MVKVNDIYQHFKGMYVVVENIASDSETLEDMVIYREFKDNKLWVRSLKMFESLVDKKKYPDVKQNHRFEFINLNDVPDEIFNKVMKQRD